jgi:FkbM family methyltransferase
MNFPPYLRPLAYKIRNAYQVARRRRIRSYLVRGERNYSQLGEQSVLENILARIQSKHTVNSVYLDIGAYHPHEGSNTFRFYQRGWRGMVVDPNPDKIRKFLRLRPDDIAIQKAVVPDSYAAATAVMRSSGPHDARESIDPEVNPNHKILEASLTYTTSVVPISKLLTQCRAQLGLPSILNLDIEGLEYAIIKSADLVEHPVPLLCIEHFLSDFSDSKSATQYSQSPLVQHLERNGYLLVSICGVSLIFAHSSVYVPFS